MSKLHTATNVRRVERIMETLGHLEVSIRSNKSGPEDIAELMQPVIKWLGDAAPSQASLSVFEVAAGQYPQDIARDASKYPKDSLRGRLEGLTPRDLCGLVELAMLKIEEELME